MSLAEQSVLLEGLRITAIGMAWVFAGLGLIWGLILLLEHFFPGKGVESTEEIASHGGPGAAEPLQAGDPDAVTAQRARVAAIVAAALQSRALLPPFEERTDSDFEDGRTAPNWVTANRARILQTWNPPRQQKD